MWSILAASSGSIFPEGWLREHQPEVPVPVAPGQALALELASKLCDVRSTFAKPYDETHVATAVAEVLDGRTATA